MKKVKTLVTIIAIMIASLFAPACMCGGSGEDVIKHIYAQGISLRLVPEGSDDTVKQIEIPGDASGKLYIECEEEDIFSIEYTISPADTTKTMVNWSFSEEGVVKPYLMEGYTRNSTSVEKVKFQAQDIPVGAGNETELTFSTVEYEKSATCIIVVRKPIEERSILLTPKNLKFDLSNNVLTWDAVTKMKSANGLTVNATNGELDSYEITEYEYNTNDGQYVQTGVQAIVPANQTTYVVDGGFNAGKVYAYSVKAIGDNRRASNSEGSDIYKFYKLNPAKNVTNNNGTVSFTPVDYTNDFAIYLDGVKTDFKKSTISPNTEANVDHRIFGSSSLVYNIQIRSYPCNVSEYNSATGYAVTDENDDQSVVYQFASDLTDTFTLYKLKAPTALTIAESGLQKITVDGSEFFIKGSNYIQIIDSIGAGQEVNNPDVGVKYEYQVYGGDSLSTPGKQGVTTDGTIKLEQLGLSSGTYRIRVWTIGDESNTISSTASGHSDTNKQYKDIVLNVLPKAGTPSMNTQVDNGDTLTLSVGTDDSRFKSGGFELLFVNTKGETKQFVVEVSGNTDTTVNLKEYVDAGKLTAGSYSLYVKNLSWIGVSTDNSANNVVVLDTVDTVKNSLSKPFDIIIASSPQNVTVSADGILSFTTVDNFEVYSLSIRRYTSVEDSRTDTVMLYKNTNANKDIDEPIYDVNGTTATISLKEVFEHLGLDENETYDGYFVNPYKFTVTMYTEGIYTPNAESTDTAVSSITTKNVDFSVNTPITTMSLINYNLSWPQPAFKPQGYIIRAYSVGENDALNSICEAQVDSSKNAVSLKELKNSEGISFADCIDGTTNTVVIEIVSLGKAATTTTTGSSLSVSASTSFKVTNKVHSLALDQQGNLTWDTDTNKNEVKSYDYNVYLYLVSVEEEKEGSGTGTKVVYELKETIPGIKATTTEGSGVPVLSTNIADVLAAYPGQTIAVSVQEFNSVMFSGAQSDYLFASRISAPTGMKYEVVKEEGDKNNYRVAWDDVNDATFSVSVSGTKTISAKTIEDNFYSISEQIGNTDNPWGAGVYTIHIITNITSNSDNAGKDYNNPIYLSSAESEIRVVIIDSAIKVTADDYTVRWENPTYEYGVNSKYTVNALYVKTSDGSTTSSLYCGWELFGEEVSEQIISINTQNKLNDPHSYNIIVTPSIDFVESNGIIYIGHPSDNNIKKFTTPTDLHAENGNLNVTINEVLPEDGYRIELYEISGENKTLLTKGVDYDSLVTVDAENNTTAVAIALLDSVSSGDHIYSVRVKSTSAAYISSDMCEAYNATKLSKTTDLAVENIDDVRFITWSGQPGVSVYKLYYYYGNDNDNVNEISLEVEYIDNGDGSYGYNAMYDDDGDGEKTNNSLIFKYENNKFYFMLDEELIVGENQGNITFSIRAFAVTDLSDKVKYRFLNGNVSDTMVITKLANASEKITIENGIISVADYSGTGSKTPLYYVVSITPIDFNAETNEYTKKLDSSNNPITYTTGNVVYVPTEKGVLYRVDLNTIVVKMPNGVNYPFTAEGDYVVELQFIGNSTDIIDSSVVESMVYKLATTSQLKTIDGVLNWKPVEGATSYTLSVEEDGGVGEALIFELGDVTSLRGIQLSLGNNNEDSNPEENPEGGEGEEILPEPASITDGVFNFNPGVTYVVKIKANSPTNKISSEWSTEFKIQKLHAPHNVRVISSTTAHSGLEIGTPLIAWENQNRTSQQQKYIIEYIMSGAVVNTVEAAYSVNTKYSQIATLNAGACNFQMKIIGNTSNELDTIGYLTSEYSTEEVSTTFIDDVSGLVFVDTANTTSSNNGMLQWSNWSDIKNAYSYKVTIYKVESVAGDNTDYTESLVASFFTTNTAIDFTANNYIDPGCTYRIEVHAVTDPTKAIVTTKTVDSDITVYRPAIIDTLMVKEGMLYWEISKSEIENYITFNSLSAKFNAKEVIDYIVKKINNEPINVNAELESTFAYLASVNMTSNGVTETKAPLRAEGLLTQDGKDFTGIGYYYSLSKEPEIDTTNTDSGKYIITVANPSNNNNNAAVMAGLANSTALTVYKPKTPTTWTYSQSDINVGKAQWELSTTIDSTLSKFDYYTNYELVAIARNGQQRAKVTIDTRTLLNNSATTGATIANGYRFAVDIKRGLFYTAQMLIDENVDITEEELLARTDLLVANSEYTLYIRAIGTEDSSKLASGSPIYLNSSYTMFNEVVNILDVPGESKIANNNLTWQPKYGSTATKVFVYGPFNNLSDANKVNAYINDYWLNDEVASQVQEMESQYLTNGTTNGLMNVYTLGLVEGDTPGTEKRETTFSLTGTLTNSGEEYLPGGYVIRIQDLGDGKGVVDSNISTNIMCHKLGYGIANPLATTHSNYDPTRIMQTNGWVGLSKENSQVYEIDDNGNTWKVKAQTDPDQTTGVFVWNPVAGANQYKIQIMYEAKDSVNEAEKEVNVFDPAVYTFYTRETTFTLPNGVAFNNNDYAYSLRITAQRTKTLDSNETLADNVFYAEYHDTTAHERLAMPTAIEINGGGYVYWDVEPNYEFGYDGSENAIQIYDKFRVLFNEGDEEGSTEETSLEVDGKSGGINLALYNQTGTIKIQIKTIARKGAVDIAQGQQVDINKVFLNSSYTSAVEVTKLANPDARLVNGIFYWGMGDDPVTTSSIRIDNGEPQTIGEVDEATGNIIPYYEWMKFYTDITEHDEDYTADSDEELYTTGEHTFSVKYDGTDGFLTADTTTKFYVTSEYADLTAYKLAAPILDKGNTSIGNVLKWQHITHALGYRIMMFGNSSEGVASTQKIEVSYEKIYTGSADGFGIDGDNIVLDLTKAITDLGISLTGGDIHIYVQAIGSGMNFDAAVGTDVSARDDDMNTLYLTSSYSTPVTYGIPSAVQNLSFDSSDGKLSWETTSSGGYYIQIDMTYKVSNITEDELYAWKESANLYYITGSGKVPTSGTYADLRGESITNRIVTNESNYSSNGVIYYTITVNDTVNLKPTNNKTPLSYNVTAIGAYSSFDVVVLTFDPTDDGQSENNFISAASTLKDAGMAFAKYKSGEGTTYNPYILTQSNHIEGIGANIDKHFKLGADIEMNTVWTTIAPYITDENGDVEYLEFTGTIDGNGFAISNYKASTGLTIAGASTMAFIYKLGEDAVIKNLTIEIAEDGMKNSGATSVVSGVVAVQNRGTIEDVTILGDINIQTDGAGSSAQAVAGIVYENYGTISGANVKGNITSMVESGSWNALAAAIAISNYGTIEYASYASKDSNNVTIKSNKLAGIALENYGLIDRSYVHETVIINAVDKNKSGNSNSKQVLAGGIAGLLRKDMYGLATASITNSYSRARIVLYVTNTSQLHSVAGFVASVSPDNTYIANSYAIVNITGTASGKVTISNFVNNGSLTSANLSRNYYIVDPDSLRGSESDTITRINLLEKVSYSDTTTKNEENLNNKLLAIANTPYEVDDNGKARIKAKTNA